MRKIIVAFAMLTAFPAGAENGPWTPAPTPNVGVADHVLPAARAGSSTGSARDAPFSGIPNASVTADGATSSNTVNDAKAPNPSPK